LRVERRRPTIGEVNVNRHGSRRVLVALLAALLGAMGPVAAGTAAAVAPLDLTLEPGYVHASFGAPETPCYPYLSPWPGAAADARDPLRPTAVEFRE
jgi:hypothetical protein